MEHQCSSLLYQPYKTGVEGLTRKEKTCDIMKLSF